MKEVFISSLISSKQLFFVSGRISPQVLRCFNKPTKASFRCWFSNNSILTFLEGCFPSSFVAEIVIFFSAPLSQQSSFYSFIPEALWCCSFHSSSCFVKIMFFSLLLRLAGVSCFHLSSLILSSFVSFLNRRAVWNLSYPLCHSFNSSGGSVLLISSSILSSCQVHVQFLPFTVGVLPKLYHSYSFPILVLTGVV